MTTLEKRFARRLDRLSGTYPNDERTSRINEKGFALCGLFYMLALAVRILVVLIFGEPYAYSYSDSWNNWWDHALLAIMVFIMLGITVKQRRKEGTVQKKQRIRLRPAELPRAAAALLSGKSPEDERTVRAFERGFAVCALLGFLYFSISFLLCMKCKYYTSNFLLMCAAPLPVGFVKRSERIMTPPRAAHIRLNTGHVLLRLPVYLLVVLPFLFALNFFPGAYDAVGRFSGEKPYSEHLLIMFFQVVGDAFRDWIAHPWLISRTGILYCVLFYLLITLYYEITVDIYKKQMRKMDAEENDLS